jgi:hypothetical protein
MHGEGFKVQVRITQCTEDCNADGPTAERLSPAIDRGRRGPRAGLPRLTAALARLVWAQSAGAAGEIAAGGEAELDDALEPRWVLFGPPAEVFECGLSPGKAQDRFRRSLQPGAAPCRGVAALHVCPARRAGPRLLGSTGRLTWPTQLADTPGRHTSVCGGASGRCSPRGPSAAPRQRRRHRLCTARRAISVRTRVPRALPCPRPGRESPG